MLAAVHFRLPLDACDAVLEERDGRPLVQQFVDVLDLPEGCLFQLVDSVLLRLRDTFLFVLQLLNHLQKFVIPGIVLVIDVLVHAGGILLIFGLEKLLSQRGVDAIQPLFSRGLKLLCIDAHLARYLHHFQEAVDTLPDVIDRLAQLLLQLEIWINFVQLQQV